MSKHSILLTAILVTASLQSAAAQNTPSVSASVSGYTAIGNGVIPESEQTPLPVTRNDGPLHAEASGHGGRYFTECTVPCLYGPAFTSVAAAGFASADPGVLHIYGGNRAIATFMRNAPNVPVTENTHTVDASINVGASFTDYLTVNFPGKAVGTPVQVPFNYLAEVVSDTLLGYPVGSRHPITVSAHFDITGIDPQIFSTDSSLPFFRTTTLSNGNMLHRVRSDEFSVDAHVGDVLTIGTTFGISGHAMITDLSRGIPDGAFADGRNTAGIWLGTLPNGMVITSASGHDYTLDPTAAATPVAPAPVTATAVAGDTLATVSFIAPIGNGAAAITGYTVTSSPDGITATGIQSPILVMGLTNGTPYTFTVIASNALGMGTISLPSNSVTPTANPAAVLDPAPIPVMDEAIAGDAQATVSFTATPSVGTSAITGYTVITTPSGITATGTTSPITVTGLTNGTAYTLTVTSSNATGTSAASVPSNSVTPVVSATIVVPAASAPPVAAVALFRYRSCWRYLWLTGGDAAGIIYRIPDDSPLEKYRPNSERGPIFWTGKLKYFDQLAKRVHESYSTPNLFQQRLNEKPST